MSTATVTNLQRFSLHDGGGIRTVVFLKGCPFRCPWCCNPENLSFDPQVSLKERLCIHCSRKPGEACPRTPQECPTGALELLGRDREADDLVAECLRDRIFYEESGGGVTLSGGECLAPVSRQPFVREFCARAKDSDVSTALETTLAIPLDNARELAKVVDTWLVDFKIADRKRSMRLLGIDTDVRDQNLRVLLDLGARVIARMPIIPGYTDSRENVTSNLATMRSLGIMRADVLPFHQLGEGKYESVGLAYGLAGMSQLFAEDVQWVADLCENAGIAAVIHGE